MWCPGTEGTGDKTAKARQQNRGKRRREGGSLRQTPCSIFKVVLFICSESISPAVPNCKGDRIIPLFPCGMEPQFIAFCLKGNPVSLLRFLTQSPIGENPFLHMLRKHGFWHIVSWSLEEHPTRQLRAVDFPVGEHMTMLLFLLELCSILVVAFGRVPQSEEAII